MPISDNNAPDLTEALNGLNPPASLTGEVTLRRLRDQAEEKMKALTVQNIEALSPEQVGRLVHELQVHQIELEIQNEELGRTQETLEGLWERYFDLYDLAPVGYVTMSVEGLIDEANLRAAAMLGMSKRELLRQPLTKWIFAEDQDRYYLQRKALFATRAPQVCELRLHGRDGALLWTRLDTILVKEGDNGLPQCRITMNDISERKWAEEEKARLQETLQQARKIESVGRLAGGVAHNFNNKLAIVVGYTEMAMAAIDHDHPAQASLQTIMEAAQDSADLSQQLLAFASIQMANPRILDLKGTITGLELMLQRVMGQDKELVWSLPPDLWQVKIDPVQVDQILGILCANARDAISGTGRITVEAKNIILEGDDCASRPNYHPGKYVRLAVTDTGCGMAPEVVKQIFEPFFSTKTVGKGIGMGLACLYGIVNQNNGFIDVISKPEEGTTVAIYLPQTAQDLPATAVTPGAPDKGHGETVLIVEDEPALLGLCKEVLEKLGYTVLTAATPAEALRRVEAHPDAIHLLLTDICMPDMNGMELTKRLTALRPGIKCLFMSGYSAQVISEQGINATEIPFIEKPFTISVLAGKVKEVLETGAPGTRTLMSLT